MLSVCFGYSSLLIEGRLNIHSLPPTPTLMHEQNSSLVTARRLSRLTPVCVALILGSFRHHCNSDTVHIGLSR